MSTTTGGFPLQADRLVTPPIHVPDDGDGSYKSELVIRRDPEKGTEKILWWHARDPREEPHNHPWDFTSTILSGGYTEERWTKASDGKCTREVRTYRAGDVNVLPRDVFHSVTAIEPNTVTHMVCGPAAPGNAWCYLDRATGELLPSADPGFVARLRALNPHLRPKA